MPSTITCPGCLQVVAGPAHVTGSDVRHPRCQEQLVAAARGKPHRCPKCDGAGTLGAPQLDPPSGYMLAPQCDLCAGDGWLAVAPKQRTTTTTTWVKP